MDPVGRASTGAARVSGTAWFASGIRRAGEVGSAASGRAGDIVAADAGVDVGAGSGVRVMADDEAGTARAVGVADAAGAAGAPGSNGVPALRLIGFVLRRATLVELKPVVPAPDAGGVP